CADGEPDCLDLISYHAAMVRMENQLADHTHGGEFGAMGDLALAIVAAVRKHRIKRLDDPDNADRLVINLSLGWAADDAVVTTDPNRGPVRSLLEALYYAT